MFSPAFWNNLEKKFNFSPTRLTFLLLIPREDVRPDLQIKRKNDEWCICCIYSFIFWENLVDSLLARTRLIANWRFPAEVSALFSSKLNISLGSGVHSEAGSHLTRRESALWWRCLLHFCCLCSCVSPPLLRSCRLCGTGFIFSLSGGSSPWCTSDKQAKGYLNYRRCCLRRFTFYFHTSPWNSQGD